MRFKSLPLFIIVFVFIVIAYVDAKCSNEPDGTYLAYPFDRSRFIYCWGGQEIVGQCDPGLEFNPFDRICDAPPGGPVNPPNQRDPCLGRPDGTFVPDPQSRNRFFFCQGGRAMGGLCDPGFEFHPIDSVCERVQQTTTQSPVPRDPCLGRPDGTFLPDPTSNTRFLYCVGSQSTVGNCPPGMIFDHIDLFCEDPRNNPLPPATTRPPGGPPPVPTRLPPVNTTRPPGVPPTPSRAPPTPSRAPPVGPQPPAATPRPPAPAPPGVTSRPVPTRAPVG